jgi:hypothetical protein
MPAADNEVCVVAAVSSGASENAVALTVSA